jgi:hypothetical protein
MGIRMQEGFPTHEANCMDGAVELAKSSHILFMLVGIGIAFRCDRAVVRAAFAVQVAMICQMQFKIFQLIP